MQSEEYADGSSTQIKKLGQGRKDTYQRRKERVEDNKIKVDGKVMMMLQQRNHRQVNERQQRMEKRAYQRREVRIGKEAKPLAMGKKSQKWG